MVFPESLDELPFYLCHIGVLLPPDIVCPPYLFRSLPFRHLPGSIGAGFSLEVRAGASGSRGRVICLRRLAGPSRGTAGRNLLGGGLCTLGFPEDGSPGVLGRSHRPFDKVPAVVVG